MSRICEGEFLHRHDRRGSESLRNTPRDFLNSSCFGSLSSEPTWVKIGFFTRREQIRISSSKVMIFSFLISLVASALTGHVKQREPRLSRGVCKMVESNIARDDRKLYESSGENKVDDLPAASSS